MKAANIESALFRAALEKSYDIIGLLDETAVILDIAPAVTPILGYSPDALAGTRVSEILHPEDLNAFESALFAPTQEAPEFQTCRLRARNGAWCEFEFKVSRIPVEDGRSCAVVIWHQVAEPNQSALQEELQSEIRHLREILANVPSVVWESRADPVTLQPRLIYINEYAEELFGYPLSLWLEDPELLLRTTHPEDLERQYEVGEQVFTTGQPRSVEYRVVASNGRSFWVQCYMTPVYDGAGQIVGLRGVTLDISDRIVAQEGQRRLASLLDAASIFAGWCDTRGAIRYINPAGRRMLGIAPDENMEGRSITTLAPPKAIEMIFNVALPTAVREGSWAGESVVLHRDGREIPVAQVVTFHRDAHSGEEYFSTVAHDITELKRAEEALKRANDGLEQRVRQRTEALANSNQALQEQMLERQSTMRALQEAVAAHEQARAEADLANQAKNDFLSRMSHELRTPLNAILGFGQILDMDESLPGRRKEGIKHILKAGQHLLNLVNEVLDISRIESGTLSLSTEPVNIADAVREVLDLMHPLAASFNIRLLDYVPTPGDGFVLADRQRFKQVLLNLISNAIKYNLPGGEVTVSSEELAAEGKVRIRVHDTGRGLSTEDITKLFTPFERLGAATTGIEGTGIGLTLSRRIIQAMKGQIGVESEAGDGSTFWVELPQAVNPIPEFHQQIAAEGIHVAQAPEPQTAKYTVLYVEDNLPNLKLVEMVLESRRDIQLIPAMQASTGMDLAVEHKPNLILLDLHLPDMNGQELLGRLQKNPVTAQIPVIVVSADATPGQVQRLMSQGAKGYLTKPINVKQFLTALDENLN